MYERPLFLKKHLYTLTLLAFLIPIKTKPTGFDLVPPFGPAIPVIDTATSLLLIFVKFCRLTFTANTPSFQHVLEKVPSAK